MSVIYKALTTLMNTKERFSKETYFYFFRAGILDIETALHTLDYLNNETEYIPWGAAVKELAYLDRMLVSTPVYGNFEVCT